MEVYARISIKSIRDGYVYSFTIPIGTTKATGVSLNPKALESMQKSIDNLKVINLEKHYIEWTMKNPAIHGISTRIPSSIDVCPTISCRAPITDLSGIPEYILTGQTWTIERFYLESQKAPTSMIFQ